MESYTEQLTPEQIAKKIFSKNYTNLGIELVDQDDETVFQIMLTILFHGLDYILGNFYGIEYNDFEEDDFNNLNKFLNKINFGISAIEIKKSELDGSHYNRVLLRNEKDEGYFILKKNNYNYTFLINSLFYEKTKLKTPTLEEYKCLFEKDESAILISFYKK